MNCILFNSPAPFRLEKDDTRLEHIKSCIKTKQGGEIYAGQIDSKLHICTIDYTEDGGANLCPVKELRCPAPLPISFCAAFTRPQIAKRILFECACFGVENVIFYAANKSESAYAESSLYRKGEYVDSLVNGAQQACATNLPKFFVAANLSACMDKVEQLQLPNREKFLYAPDVYEAEIPLKAAAANFDPKKSCATILIGGERGFDNLEREELRLRGYTLVGLGNRVLRTDTATIAALSCFA